ncbi:MAG: prenyltransferase/squalene oxidase repeat-containing protein [Phycisphaeraceae bacterium]
MRWFSNMTVLALLVFMALPAAALDDAHWKKANAAIDKGIAYLREAQAEDGSWMSEVGPAVTGLALTALLEQPDIGPDDPAAKKAIAYILARVQEDGSIRNGPDGILANYNTALCLSALARVGNDPDVADAIKKGQDFLRGTQWIVGMKDPDGNTIDKDHPYYGGFGYGTKGRPDISNTQMALQALHDTGVDCEDPAFQRALTFLNRLQATEQNDLNADKFDQLDGGFIYATSINKDAIGVPESKASQDQIDEGLAGRPVSGLRTYGSVTYAGFKSLIYANLDRDDPRVVSAMSWISKNYELDRNPGMPEEQKLQGLYYFYLAKARAMNALGHSTVKVVAEDGSESTRDWANDLIAAIVSQQHPDGWWANTESRWLESQPVLVTAYSVIALQNAID